MLNKFYEKHSKGTGNCNKNKENNKKENDFYTANNDREDF